MGSATREGFLLLCTERFNSKLERKAKRKRMYCVLEAGKLRCFDKVDDVTPDVLPAYARRQKAAIVVRMAEVVQVVAAPYGIEESSEKMRLRKNSESPLALRLTVHQAWEGAQDRTLEFAAEAGGNVRRWIKALHTATWEGAPLASSFLGMPEPRGVCAVVVKLLLDSALHPEAAKTASAALVARQRTCPRALVLCVDPESCTGWDLCTAVCRATGFPAQRLAVWHRDPETLRLARLADRARDEPLRRWLESLPVSGRVALEARVLSDDMSKPRGSRSRPLACPKVVESSSVCW